MSTEEMIDNNRMVCMSAILARNVSLFLKYKEHQKEKS